MNLTHLQLAAICGKAFALYRPGCNSEVEKLAFRVVFDRQMIVADDFLVSLETTELPTKPIELYALSLIMAHCASAEELLPFIDQLISSGLPEFSVLTIRNRP